MSVPEPQKSKEVKLTGKRKEGSDRKNLLHVLHSMYLLLPYKASRLNKCKYTLVPLCSQAKNKLFLVNRPFLISM